MTDNENKPAFTLATCPFCGGSAKSVSQTGDERDGYMLRMAISCIDCGATVTANGDTSKVGYADNTTVGARAMEAWNRRATKASAVPEGMVLVPKKPTSAMIDAYNDVPSGIAGSPPHGAHVWGAMLAAAPQAEELKPEPKQEAEAVKKPTGDRIVSDGTNATTATMAGSHAIKTASASDNAASHAQSSITEDADFRQWAAKFRTEANGGPAYEGLWKLIDAKLTQARHYAWCEDVNIDGLREHNAELVARATAAEEKLASIRAELDKE